MGKVLKFPGGDDHEPDGQDPQRSPAPATTFRSRDQRARDNTPTAGNPKACWKDGCPERQTDASGCPAHGIG